MSEILKNYSETNLDIGPNDIVIGSYFVTAADAFYKTGGKAEAYALHLRLKRHIREQNRGVEESTSCEISFMVEVLQRPNNSLYGILVTGWKDGLKLQKGRTVGMRPISISSDEYQLLAQLSTQQHAPNNSLNEE